MIPPPSGHSGVAKCTFRILIVAAIVLSVFCTTGALAVQQESVIEEALAGPLSEVKEIIFAVRGHVKNLHYYENYGRLYGDNFHIAEGGGRLCRMNLRTRQITDILNDPEGAVRDPQVHYGGQKILFSYRPGGETRYHLYEINVDGTGLKQLTDGDEDDIEPTYMPDGRIMFISTRGHRRVPCWSSQVGILYRCDADGSNIVCLSASVEHENTPWLLPDGRALYTRWEYVDRDEVAFHHLWVINPDGTRQMTFYGNMQKHGNCVAMLDAKPVPGTGKVVCTYAFHNTPEHGGEVRVIDPDRGPDDLDSAKLISDEYPESIGRLGHTSNGWRDPYPVSENCFLVASQKSLYVMDGEGNWERLYEHKEGTNKLWVHEPRPLLPRSREDVIVDTTDWSKDHGTLALYEAHTGRKMDGVEAGTIKELLIMEELPKAVSYSVDMDATSLDGTFLLHRIVGKAPVEEDGSAYFDLPANRGFFFVALDDEGRAVKRMMSFTSVAPGEKTSCVGCHEARTMAPPPDPDSKMPAAMRRTPSAVQPVEGVPEIIDYNRDIQPIWDKNCITCHNYEKYAGELSLTGASSPTFVHSYLNLHYEGLISHGRQGLGNRAPYSIGAHASRLWDVLENEHHDVKLTLAELKMVRYWIESSAAYAGTLAGLGMRYRKIRVKIDEKKYENRCGTCHSPGDIKGRWLTGWSRVRDRRYNLSHPEKSLVLLAPLAKEAGGLGLCEQREPQPHPLAPDEKEAEAPPAEVFTSKEDPFYWEVLAALRDAAEQRRRMPEYFKPGFEPWHAYPEVMKRFGILPEDWNPEGARLKDYFPIDQKYWEHLWHTPESQ